MHKKGWYGVGGLGGLPSMPAHRHMPALAITCCWLLQCSPQALLSLGILDSQHSVSFHTLDGDFALLRSRLPKGNVLAIELGLLYARLAMYFLC